MKCLIPYNTTQPAIGQIGVFAKLVALAIYFGKLICYTYGVEPYSRTRKQPGKSKMGNFLHGLHDIGGEHLMQSSPGWIVHAISLQETRSFDYRNLTSQGFSIITRLNWGWYPDGTIPVPAQYPEMAKRCAEFVAASPGCDRVIIGNEFNHVIERPHELSISAEDASKCHVLCYDAIKQASSNAKIVLAGIAPWNIQTGDWLAYLSNLTRLVGSKTDGYALHAYTHGDDPNLIFSDEKRNEWYWHLKTYLDQISRIVSSYPDAANKEFHITESDQGDNAWTDKASGWIPNALKEINEHNSKRTPKIRSISFYRWSTDDKYSIKNKSGVQQDFVNGVNMGFITPPWSSVPVVPVTPDQGENGQTPPEKVPDVEWDPRLTARGVKIVTPNLESGFYWKVIKGQWYDESEADSVGGDHHIYYNFYDVNGARLSNIKFTVKWPSDQVTLVADKPLSEQFSGNYPMSSSLHEYNTWVEMGSPTEIVTGIGMGANGNPSIHTSTELAFQLTVVAPQSEGSTIYIPDIQNNPNPPETVAPSPPNLDSSNRSFHRVMEFVHKWEGGFQNVENDSGNWTSGVVGKGELKGTNFGISAASYPSLDIKNLTQEQSDEILYRDFWIPSGASGLSWPGNLIVMDTAVLHGKDTAKMWLADAGPNPLNFAAKRLAVYPRLDNWNYWGKAWVLRVADLLKEAAKP